MGVSRRYFETFEGVNEAPAGGEGPFWRPRTGRGAIVLASAKAVSQAILPKPKASRTRLPRRR